MKNRFSFLYALCFFSVHFFSTPLFAGESFLSGAGIQQALAGRQDIYLSEKPLRQAIADLVKEKRTPCFLDRRIDGEQKITLSLKNATLREIWNALALQVKGEISELPLLLYLGPPKGAASLRTLIEMKKKEIGQAPAFVSKMNKARTLFWEDYTSVVSIVSSLEEEYQIPIESKDLIPHDLWRKNSLPSLPLAEKLTLLLLPFDLTFSLSENPEKITIVSLPQEICIEKEFPLPSSISEWEKRAMERKLQDALSVQGTRVIVRGRVEEIEWISGRIKEKPKNARPIAMKSKRFTLTVKERDLLPLLKQLSRQIEVNLIIPSEIEKEWLSTKKNISFSIKDATLEELFNAALRETPYRAVWKENHLEVEPKKGDR